MSSWSPGIKGLRTERQGTSQGHIPSVVSEQGAVLFLSVNNHSSSAVDFLSSCLFCDYLYRLFLLSFVPSVSPSALVILSVQGMWYVM
jgi:hypothetical protein